MSRPSKGELPDRRRFWVLCLAMVLAVLAVYGRVLHFDFVNVDDDVYVTDNSQVLQGLTWGGIGWAFTNLTAGFWHPLTWLSLMLDATWYGKQAWGFHLTNLLLHLGSTVVLFATLQRATGKLWRSALVAALFALHPLHVEAVAWVAERKEVLSAFFGFVSIYFYVRHAQPASASRKAQIANYSLSLAFFLCGLMSKTMIVTLPAVMLLLDYWPLKRITFPLPTSHFRLLVEKLPFFALGLVAGLLTIHAEGSIGALGTTAHHPLSVHVANAAVSYVEYLLQLLWPANLAMPYPPPESLPLTVSLAAGAALAGLCGLAVWLGRRRPYFPVGWFWYLTMLLPVSGLIQVGAQSRADRYTYMPLVGAFVVLVWGGAELCKRWRVSQAAMAAAAAAIMAACAARASVQLAYWQNSDTLFRHALAVTRNNLLAHNYLAIALASQGKLGEAVQHYEQALQIYPDYAGARLNLGDALRDQGKLDEAVQEYERGLRLKPASVEGHNNLGNVLIRQGKLPEAAQQLEQALQLKPDFVEAQNNMGIVLSAMGKLEEAVPYFERALQLKPDSVEVHCDLGVALARLGRLPEAAQQFEQALQLKPDSAEACFNLGLALAGEGKRDDAIQRFQQALDNATAQNDPAFANAIRAQLQQVQASGGK
jgi:tetratricopeptide (TPR) repeat protein